MAKRSATPVKGMRKAFTGEREPMNASQMMALVPVKLGMGAMGSPMPSEGDTRRLEDRRGTTTRLRETIKLMNGRKV